MKCPASEPRAGWASAFGRLRRPAVLTVALLACVIMVNGCGSDDEPTSADTRATAVEYVGGVAGANLDLPALEAPAGDFFIAVAVEGSKVEAYTCDGAANDFRFLGDIVAGQLALRSENGRATLTASVTSTAIEGTLTIDGNPQSFRAPLATGIGGLYTLKVSDLAVSGLSRRGNHLSATFENKPEVSYDGMPIPYSGTITTTDGVRHPISGAFGAAEPTGAFDAAWNILLDSGNSRGNKTTTAKRIAGTPWVDPDPTP